MIVLIFTSQEEQSHFPGGIREPLPADHLSLKKLGRALLALVQSRWGENPRALFLLRASRRGRLEARCWQIALRGSVRVQFISFAAARPYFSKYPQNLPTTCTKTSKSFEIPSQTLPKPSPNLAQILPRPSQNRSKRLVGPHLRLKLEKNLI